MLNNKLNPEAGFGIIHVLATLVIASVAIAGLFVTNFYVRQKAQENYHTRVALLEGADTMEKIRWFNRNNQGPVNVSIVGIAHEFTIDERDGQPLKARVHNPVVRLGQTDLAVAPYAIYDVVTVKITWEEGAQFNHFDDYNNHKEIILREDYFRRMSQGGN